VFQQYPALHWHLASTDRPHIRDGVTRGAKWAGRDQCRAIAGEAGNTADRRRFDGSGMVIAGRMVVSCRASIDFPAPG
jgi:hypothetical protein